MTHSRKNNYSKKSLLITTIGGILFCLGWILSYKSSIISSAVLIADAAALYFAFVYIADNGNVLSFKGLFSAFWIGTIGLSNLKLLNYQTAWETKTWLCLIMTYAAFNTGIILSQKINISTPLCKLNKKIGDIFGFCFETKQSRLFAVCLIAGIVGISSFIYTSVQIGILPIANENVHAYAEFSSRFHMLTVGSMAVSGLCWYTIRKTKLSKSKKILLYLIIFFESFLWPLLAVSRGNQMMSLLMMIPSVVASSKKRLITFIVCMAVAFGAYEVGSIARNLTDDYLDMVFEPKSVEQFADARGPKEKRNDDSSYFDDSVISPKLAFLYGYLTVSHDNFNEAVKYNTEYTCGIRQLKWLTLFFYDSPLKHKLDKVEFYQVKYELNTGNIITDFYYDFGMSGILLLVLFWSVILGFAENNALPDKPFTLIFQGIGLIPAVLCFHNSWFGHINLWLFAGTAFAMWVASAVKKA